MTKIHFFIVLFACVAISAQASVEKLPRNCEDLLASGHRKSGSYQIFPNGDGAGFRVFCDMETDQGAWIVIQKRQEPRSLDCVTSFERKWEEYASGFGNIEGDFWLGLNQVHNLTNKDPYQLRVDLMDWEGESRHATYGTFQVASESEQFKLTVSGYDGDAGDSLEIHNGMKFSTKDRDNDRGLGHCAQVHHGAWWHNNCQRANLNGPYVMNGDDFVENDGIIWRGWRGTSVSLKRTEMKIRSWDFARRR